MLENKITTIALHTIKSEDINYELKLVDMCKLVVAEKIKSAFASIPKYKIHTYWKRNKDIFSTGEYLIFFKNHGFHTNNFGFSSFQEVLVLYLEFIKVETTISFDEFIIMKKAEIGNVEHFLEFHRSLFYPHFSLDAKFLNSNHMKNNKTLATNRIVISELLEDKGNHLSFLFSTLKHDFKQYIDASKVFATKTTGYEDFSDFEMCYFRGFAQKSNYDEFLELGFRNKPEYDEYKQTKFEDMKEYVTAKIFNIMDKEIFEEFISSQFYPEKDVERYFKRDQKQWVKLIYSDEMQKFETIGQNYLTARNGGFSSWNEFNQAKKYGFSSYAMFLAFKQSGFQSKEEFDNFLNNYKYKIPKIKETIAHCIQDAKSASKAGNYTESFRLYYTALERKVEKTFITLTLTPLPEDIIEKIIKILEEKTKTTLADQTEIAFWRRTRNKIIHDNYKLDQHTMQKGLFFIEDLLKKLNNIDKPQDWLHNLD